MSTSGEIDLEGALSKLVDAARKGLKAAAQDVLERSNANIPTASGALKASGRVRVSGTTAGIGYGTGESAPYAVAQHERTELRHDDGQAKFLEQAWLDDQTGQTLVETIRREAGL